MMRQVRDGPQTYDHLPACGGVMRLPGIGGYGFGMHFQKRRKHCELLSPPMLEDGFRFACSLPYRHPGLHFMEHEGEVIAWEDYAEPRIPVPKPDIIVMPYWVAGGREDFWLQLGMANYGLAYSRHNSDRDGNYVPMRKMTGLPDGSTWIDHMWKLTPGTRIYDHTDMWTVLMVAETPVSVIIWTNERPDAPLVYGGERTGRGGNGGSGPASIQIDILYATKIIAQRHGEPFEGVYEDIFVPIMGCRS